MRKGNDIMTPQNKVGATKIFEFIYFLIRCSAKKPQITKPFVKKIVKDAASRDDPTKVFRNRMRRPTCALRRPLFDKSFSG